MRNIRFYARNAAYQVSCFFSDNPSLFLVAIVAIFFFGALLESCFAAPRNPVDFNDVYTGAMYFTAH